MDRLCDEILQLIFYELPDPSPLTIVSRRFYAFSQDPYVRATYFLMHYGSAEALFYALGRGKVLTERVLDGEDDGSVFVTFLKENRIPSQMKTITWEEIKVLMEEYHFIPFSSKDPIMPQFPLALAIEPRLLPYAVANGFSMDYKYRDFIFRKMFERPSSSVEMTADDIVANVKELCKLDPAMFVSRTVAAEVCMEAKFNDVGYSALKKLDKSGQLRFELGNLVEDLLKTFLTTRSICTLPTGDILIHLFSDFPTADVTVRLVMLVVIFLSADSLSTPIPTIRTKLESLGLAPLTKRDAYNILINPFVERYGSLLQYMRQEAGSKSDGSRGMCEDEIMQLLAKVATKCLEIACKGKILKKIVDDFPVLKDQIGKNVLEMHQLHIDDVPSWNDDAHMQIEFFGTKLSRDFSRVGLGLVHTRESLMPEPGSSQEIDSNDSKASALRRDDLQGIVSGGSSRADGNLDVDLGPISQESLTAMIRHDETTPVRSRRRMLYLDRPFDSSSRQRFPHDTLPVGRWIKSQYGPRSSITAVFMTHAIINNNSNILHHYLVNTDGSSSNPRWNRVPITLKHFQILAQLGHTPNFYLWHDIEVGAEFYMDESDYIDKQDPAHALLADKAVKVETEANTNLRTPTPSASRKRPRRSAAHTVQSYAVPDSDDEAIAAEEPLMKDDDQESKPRSETNLQLWIKHLGQLLKVEMRKYSEHKKRLEKQKINDVELKIRVPKNDFVKSLTTNLRSLRKLEEDQRSRDHAFESAMVEYSDEDDDEYVSRQFKRRRNLHT
ncbi:hypothetical protein CVT24_001367 [Panaeolus cyanescens]|uniref:Uncharacterized protein n=1 Tax=Panaeolus cyanescens TaxID=181874 RepID=A0A409VTK6_9AGAR|nr:hypothetical protein CVT24_001367 [Panaeolus cyanescens]